MKLRWIISGLCLLMFAGTAWSAPKEKPRKGKPADQAVLDLGAIYTDEAQTRADGNLNDWTGISPLAFSTLIAGEYDYDWTGPKDLSANVMAQYGASKIFFVVSVKDNAVVAKRKQWKSDRIELWLGAENADGKPLGNVRGILLDVGPQVEGGKATTKFMSGKQDGLEAVAFVNSDGYDFEIAVDYSALTKVSPVMNGTMRYCVLVRDWDQDDPNEDEAAIATCPINPKKSSSIKRNQMGKIALNLGNEIWSNVLRSDPNLDKNPSSWQRLEADVGGTDMNEMIMLSDQKLVVAGIGLENSGLSWFIMDMPSAMAQTKTTISAKDVDGDKRADIIIKRNEHCQNGAMHASRVYVFSHKDHSIKLIADYIEEVRYDDPAQKAFVRNGVKLTPKGVVQTLDAKSAADMPTCDLPFNSDMMPMLTKDDGTKSRTLPYL